MAAALRIGHLHRGDSTKGCKKDCVAGCSARQNDVIRRERNRRLRLVIITSIRNRKSRTCRCTTACLYLHFIKFIFNDNKYKAIDQTCYEFIDFGLKGAQVFHSFLLMLNLLAS